MANIVDYWYTESDSLTAESLFISQTANWHTDVESAETDRRDVRTLTSITKNCIDK